MEVVTTEGVEGDFLVKEPNHVYYVRLSAKIGFRKTMQSTDHFFLHKQNTTNVQHTSHPHFVHRASAI